MEIFLKTVTNAKNVNALMELWIVIRYVKKKPTHARVMDQMIYTNTIGYIQEKMSAAAIV